jgi:hypothetical protein
MEKRTVFWGPASPYPTTSQFGFKIKLFFQKNTVFTPFISEIIFGSLKVKYSLNKKNNNLEIEGVIPLIPKKEAKMGQVNRFEEKEENWAFHGEQSH